MDFDFTFLRHKDTLKRLLCHLPKRFAELFTCTLLQSSVGVSSKATTNRDIVLEELVVYPAHMKRKDLNGEGIARFLEEYQQSSQSSNPVDVGKYVCDNNPFSLLC